MKHSRFGFTLIELMLSITLMFIVFGITTGFYSRFFTQNAVQITQNQLVASLRKAQMYAMMGKRNSNWGVNINTTARQITLFAGANYASRTPAFDEIYIYNNNLTVSGFTDVVYAHATGIPSSFPTVTITGANQTKIVTVNTQGIVSK